MVAFHLRKTSKMAIVGFWILLILASCSNSVAQKFVLRTNLYEERFRGAYNIRVYCDYIGANENDVPLGKFDLLTNDQNVLMSRLPTPAASRTWRAEFYIPTRHIQPFHRLHCKYANLETENSISWPFFICHDYQEECALSTCTAREDDPRFCMYTERGIEPCLPIYHKNMCHNEDDSYLFCPANVTGICKATLQAGNGIFYRMPVMDGATCHESAYPPITYKGNYIAYGQTFEVDQSEKFLRIRCPQGSAFYNSTFEVQLVDDIDNNFPLMAPQGKCAGEMAIKFGEIFEEGADTYEVVLNAALDGGQQAQFINTLVVFGTNLKISKPAANTLFCNFTAPVGSAFQVTMFWTKRSAGGERFNVKKSTLPMYYKRITFSRLWITESDEYQCYAELTYRNCAPHRVFTKIISSDRIFADFVGS